MILTEMLWADNFLCCECFELNCYQLSLWTTETYSFMQWYIIFSMYAMCAEHTGPKKDRAHCALTPSMPSWFLPELVSHVTSKEIMYSLEPCSPVIVAVILDPSPLRSSIGQHCLVKERGRGKLCTHCAHYQLPPLYCLYPAPTAPICAVCPRHLLPPC